VGLAARGSRKTGELEEHIEDDGELHQVRRQARWVHIKSLLAGLLLTAIALALPDSIR
jgi:hypothetical protein